MAKVAPLWALFVFITQAGSARGDTVFLQRNGGDSVVLPCAVEPREPREPAPYGVYLKRRWLDPRDVLFKYKKEERTVGSGEDENRIKVSGDAGLHALNVTISQLRAADTDRYVCHFMVASNSAEDEARPGSSEFFLLVKADAPVMADVGLVEACSGGSAELPCLPPRGEEALPVEGVSLTRQRGQAPAEVLYHSKGHHAGDGGGPPPASAPPSRFPAERVQLSSAPGPGGIAYKLTLLQLQPADSALYSCQLLLRGEPDTGTGLGTRAVFVSVQGGQCGCSNYSTLLYALSSAVVLLLLLLLALLFVVFCKGKARRSDKSHPQHPIYEEMTGLQPGGRKPHPRHLEEPSEYTNCQVKKSCPENHYESPSGALSPLRDDQK